MKKFKKFIAVVAICLLAAQAVATVAPAADSEVTMMARAKSDIDRKPIII